MTVLTRSLSSYMQTDPISHRLTADALFLSVLACCLLGVSCFLLAQGPALSGQDFRIFYTAPQMLLHSRAQLYDLAAQQEWQQRLAGGTQVLPFYHPAYEVLLYLPLTLFRFRAAYLIYAAFNVGLLWLCYRVSPHGNSALAGKSRYALFFLSFPLLLTIFFGQNSLLLLLGLCLAYNAIVRGKDFHAGVIVGLLIFKLALTVPVAVLLCFRRGREFLGGGVLASAASLALSAFLVGVSGMKDFLYFLTGATLAANPGIQSHVPVALQDMPNLSGLFFLCELAGLNAHIALAMNVTATVVVLAGCVYIQRSAQSEALAYSAAVVCAVLISPHVYIYDLAALVLPMLLLAHRWLRYAAIVWFTLPAFLYCFGFLNWFAFAVVIPLLLLGCCVAELRENRSTSLRHDPSHIAAIPPAGANSPA